MTKNKKGIWKFFFWPAVWIMVFFAASLLDKQYDRSPSMGHWSIPVGIAVLLWGLTVHIVAGKTLKKRGHTTGHKSIWPDQLVTSGIYSCMRHPQHLGLALIPLGIALLLGSITAIFTSGWAILAASLFVIIIEEPECQEKFSDEYFRYMQRTPPLSLSVKCLATGWKELKKF
ncbi:MAG: isoprenylcysteine carboxylmethyltransferase family protein [Desulfuromonas sp.]|nr:isoprenylcysteine carboxylmethyltransferase family protein [Desulfuromonas sp.]